MTEPKPLRPLSPELMAGLHHAVRQTVAASEPDVIAVVVLTGSPERGLAMSIHSEVNEQETMNLLSVAVAGVASEEGWIEEPDDEPEVPFLAVGNSEPLPEGLPPWLKDTLRQGRTEAGWCDHGERLSTCTRAHPK